MMVCFCQFLPFFQIISNRWKNGGARQCPVQKLLALRICSSSSLSSASVPTACTNELTPFRCRQVFGPIFWGMIPLDLREMIDPAASYSWTNWASKYWHSVHSWMIYGLKKMIAVQGWLFYYLNFCMAKCHDIITTLQFHARPYPSNKN